MKSAIFIKIFLAWGLLTALTLPTGCSSEHQPERKIVAVSIPPEAALLKEIGGDSIEIVTLLRSDSNPETFEVTISDMRAIHNAEAFLAMGNLPFEATLLQKIGESSPQMKLYNMSDSIELIYGTHSHGRHTHSVADPHTWSSLPNMKQIAANMVNALTEIDPANAEYYRENYGRLTAKLDSIDSAMATKMMGREGTTFLVWHPSLSYFARDYGLNQVILSQENKEMSAKSLRHKLDELDNGSVAAIFIQDSLDPRQALNIARQLGIEPVGINPLDGDWESQFNIIADAITK